jgi:hypothetical protein
VKKMSSKFEDTEFEDDFDDELDDLDDNED